LTAEEDRAAAIPVFEEKLHVDKTISETDRVFIRTSVLERTEYADLDLRSDEATIERVPVGRIVDAPPAIRQEGGTVIVPVLEEIMVVQKRLLLKARSTSVARTLFSTFANPCGCAPRRFPWNGSRVRIPTPSPHKRIE
jgi:uncharacterized protein (TIGR02271 family)